MPQAGNRNAVTIAAKANREARSEDLTEGYVALERAVKRGMDRRSVVLGLASYLGFSVPTKQDAPAAVTSNRGAE